MMDKEEWNRCQEQERPQREMAAGYPGDLSAVANRSLQITLTDDIHILGGIGIQRNTRQ